MRSLTTLLMLLILCGCGFIEAEGVHRAESADVESEQPATAAANSIEEASGVISIPDLEYVATDDPISEPRQSADNRPSFFDGVRQMIGDNPAFEDAELSTGLVETLERAEEAFQEVRQSNREAIRGMNRQVRVGKTKSAPNIILVTIPQLRFDHLADMPRLSGVKSSGRTFTNFYAASDDLQAAHWSLLSGHVAAKMPADKSLEKRHSLSEVMWQSGYETALYGGWGLRQHPVELGFEHWTGFPAESGAIDRYPEFFFTQSTKARIVHQPDGQQHSSLDLLGQECKAFLTRHAQSVRPFFLHLMLPYVKGLKEQENVKLVDNSIGQLVDDLNTTGLSGKVCLLIAGETSNHDAIPQTIQEVKLAASQVGLNEGNLRTPLIVFWGLTAERGSTSDFPCTAIDLFPTLCDVAMSQRHPGDLTGVSLLKEIRGDEVQVARLLYWRLDDGGQAARRGRWKVILPPGEQKMRLYDLDTDPAETKDISEQHPDVIRGFIAKPQSQPTDEEAI